MSGKIIPLRKPEPAPGAVADAFADGTLGRTEDDDS